MMKSLFAGAVIVGITRFSAGQSLPPTVTGWSINTDDRRGTSGDSELNSYLTTMKADVLEVWHTASNVYVKSNSIPSHSIGPWGPRQEYPTAQNNAWSLLRTPPAAPAATHVELPLGAIGVMVNGVQLFSWSDATSYENENVWHAVAPVVRPDLDSALGHPSPPAGAGPPRTAAVHAAEKHTHAWTDDPDHTHDTRDAKVLTAAGAYHYHTQSPSLRAQLGDDGTRHSPILGFAFDGVPIYGPYGYANTDGTGGIKRIRTSYRKRAITQRTTLPDGTALASNLHGPAVGPTYPLGSYKEDYEFAAGLGDLDVYNGRQGVTPEYPEGVYAYFATIDTSGASAFPYTIGLNYWATPVNGNLGPQGGHVTIPTAAVQYLPSSRATWIAANQTVRIISTGGGWQELTYNYTTGDLQVSPYFSASGTAAYNIVHDQWVGVFHYDYASAAFTQAMYSLPDLL